MANKDVIDKDVLGNVLKIATLSKSQGRDQRRVALKLDCVDTLEYTEWEPGLEYKRTFLVRNIATKVQTLRWELPISPYFEVQFQEPHARLGPMMIVAINIVFRPAKLENYTSSVEFRTQRGQFTLQLKGLLPVINLGIPEALDFSYGPVYDVTERTFMMKNTSDITVTYEWVVEPPFSIHPTRSSIQQGKSEMVYCRFKPEKAAAFAVTALCCTYLGVASELKLKGIGKYSFLATSTSLLEFGEITNRTTKELTIVVTNISIVPAKFYVQKLENLLNKTDANFTVIPMNGVIKANKQFSFKVIFNPITAGTFSLEKFEIHTCQTCRASFSCSGTAARPVVKLSTFLIDFGSVEAGGYISRSVLVDNQSIIPVYFQFMSDDMRVFEFVQARAVCRPKRAMMITIHFRPLVIANYYRRVILVIQDQHALYCDLLGTCYKVALKAPTLMQYHVDQHRELLKSASVEVEVAADQGKATFPSKKSVLANIRPYFTAPFTSPSKIKKGLSGAEWESERGAWHTMLEDPKAAEKKASKPDDPTSPKAPKGEAEKMVTFEPGSNPHQTDKFAPDAANLANIYLNPAEGTAGQGPRHRTSAQRSELAQQLLDTEVQKMVDEFGEDNIGPDGVPYRRKSRLDSRYLVFQKTWQRGMEGYKRMYHHEIWDEYYIGRMEYWEPVTIDNQVLDFGMGVCMQLSEPQFLNVHNNLQMPVTLLWLVPRPPKVAEFTGIKPRPPPNKLERMMALKATDQPDFKNTEIFHVVPDKATIPVGGSYTFSIIFEPKAPNNHYCQYLHLFVWTPSQDRVIPPWSTTVCAAGHSFVMQSQEFPPEYSVSKSKINFPAVLKGFSVYQTIVLRNHNATVPMSFIFELDNLLEEFVVKPEQGLVPPGDFQLITFRYDAGEPQKITARVRCVLNHSAIDDLTFTLNASSHVPKLVLEKNGLCCFKPTSVGTRTTLYIILRNASAIATEFEWQVPKKLAEVFIIKPIAGVLRTGESVSVSVCFIPKLPHLYYCKIPCRAFAHVEKAYIQDNGMAIENVPTREVNRIQLVANGEGIDESIQIQPDILDYEFVLVGHPHLARITLKNVSAGSLRFALRVRPRNDHRNCEITFDRAVGQLHGHAQIGIMVTFHAYEEMKFEFDIICETYLPLQEMPQYVNLLPGTDPLKYMSADYTIDSPSGKTATSLLLAYARYPYLQVAAVRSEGLSCPQLWRELQVRKLNKCLAGGRLPVKPSGEAIYEDSFCVGRPVDHSRAFVFDFGAQMVSTNQTIVDLVLRSGNELPVAWNVRMWNDLEVDIENWVTPMQPTEEERRWMIMRRFNLFHAEPRRGYIPPGDEQYLRFRYVHLMEGEHVFPAIIEVQNGRTIHLELRGRSLPEPPRILVMDVETKHLDPTPVGDLNPAYQSVELCNRGPVDIDYNVDTTALEHMMRENYDFRVLWCQNPSGIIPALQSILLNWVFQPLEPKQYEVTVPVQIDNGEGRELRLYGQGVHSQNLRELEEMRKAPNSPPDLGRTYNWPDVPVILSTELIDFQEVVELSEKHRLVAIQSLVCDCRVEFKWFNSAAAEQNVSGTFQVFPKEGILDPGKEILCKVQFTAGIQPQIFETSLILNTKRIPLEYGELISLAPDTPPMEPVEVLYDTWPTRLTMGFETRYFKHDCVIERFTRTAKLHMTSEALQKLERLERNRDFERKKQLEKENLTFNPPPPVYSNLYLTVESHICMKVYDDTVEDRLTTHERLSFPMPERTEWDVQAELAFGIVMEFLQECLHDEMKIGSFENLETGGIMCFEKFKKRSPPPSRQVDDAFDGLLDGQLPTEVMEPQEFRQIEADDKELEAPRPSLEDPTTMILQRGIGDNDPDSWMLQALTTLTSLTGEDKSGKHGKGKPRVPSIRAPEIAYNLLEDALFLLVKELFEYET